MSKFEIPEAETKLRPKERDLQLERGVFKRIEARSYDEITFDLTGDRNTAGGQLSEISDEILEKRASELFKKFQEMQRGKPKIEGSPEYVPFDAEAEMKKIIHDRHGKDSPQETRRRIAAVREKLAKQQLGIAETIQNLELAVMINPQMDLYSYVREAAPVYSFSKEQLKNFYDGIKEFGKRRKAVEKYRAGQPNDEGLYENLFGKKPKGKVEVIDGMITLHVKCFDEEDYNFAYSVGIEKPDSAELDDEIAKSSAGALLSRSKISGLKNIISIGKGNSRVMRHEEQHAFNKLFEAKGRIEPVEAAVDRSLLTLKSKDYDYKEEEAKERVIYAVARHLRKLIVNESVREEILSFYREGVSSKSLFDRLSSYEFIKDYEKIYGPLEEEVRISIEDSVSEVSYKENVARNEKYLGEDEQGYIVDYQRLSIPEEEIKPYVDIVFGEELVKDLRKWIDAVIQLEKMGYSRDDVLALLYQEPIDKWAALARRLASVERPVHY